METEKATSALTPRDVCEIIRVCSETGVRRLSFAGLRVSFAGGPLPETLAKPPAESTPEAVAAAEAMDIETRRQDDQRAKDQVMAEMAIVDPDQYEALMEQEALVDENRPNEDSISSA